MHNAEISKMLGKLQKDIPEEMKPRRILQCTIIAKMSEKRKSKRSQKVEKSEPTEAEDNSELLAAAMAIGSSNRQNELQQQQLAFCSKPLWYARTKFSILATTNSTTCAREIIEVANSAIFSNAPIFNF